MYLIPKTGEVLANIISRVKALNPNLSSIDDSYFRVGRPRKNPKWNDSDFANQLDIDNTFVDVTLSKASGMVGSYTVSYNRLSASILPKMWHAVSTPISDYQPDYGQTTAREALRECLGKYGIEFDEGMQNAISGTTRLNVGYNQYYSNSVSVGDGSYIFQPSQGYFYLYLRKGNPALEYKVPSTLMPFFNDADSLRLNKFNQNAQDVIERPKLSRKTERYIPFTYFGYRFDELAPFFDDVSRDWYLSDPEVMDILNEVNKRVGLPTYKKITNTYPLRKFDAYTYKFARVSCPFNRVPYNFQVTVDSETLTGTYSGLLMSSTFSSQDWMKGYGLRNGQNNYNALPMLAYTVERERDQ